MSHCWHNLLANDHIPSVAMAEVLLDWICEAYRKMTFLFLPFSLLLTFLPWDCSLFNGGRGSYLNRLFLGVPVPSSEGSNG